MAPRPPEMRWTIDEMEQMVKGEADDGCGVKIGGHWLEVLWKADGGYFEYKWGKNFVPREVAVSVLHKQSWN